MRKFYLYSLLTALLLLCSNVASAHDFEVDGIFYNITSSTQKTVAVTYSGSSFDAVADVYSGIVTIPSTITYNDVTYNVTSIEDSAFRGCTEVVLVKISEGIKIIGDFAFYGCSGLVTVTIPNSVTSIGGYAFGGCSSLAKLNIPNSVTSIGGSAFRGCMGLTSINIPNSVTSIGDCAFYECFSLAKLNIPNSVTSIGGHAFYRCTSLTSITIGTSVTSIGGYAFNGCTGLTAVHITDLSAWCKINFATFASANPLCYGANLYLNGEKVTNLVIPSDITEIKGYAFYGCTSLTSVTIPTSVTSIGERAFYDCSVLTSVTIPNSVTSIGERAFYDCSVLTSVTIPTNVTSIGGYAFNGCTGLTAVHITDLSAWCKINFATFASANPLCYGANLYLNGEKVTNLVIPSDITEIKGYAFYGCSGLTSVTIPNSVTSIGDYAFSGCSGLTDITFHDNVMLINQSAFKGCSGLTNVTIGSGVMVLGANAFADCSNLRCVTIPNSVISIGGKAFYGCSNLYTVIDYSDLGITKGSTDNGYVGYYATHIYTSGDDIPQDYIFETIDGVNTLVAYFGKSNDVVLPSNYNGGNYAIGDSVFYNSSITSIKIPNSVTMIGGYAFYDCTGLTSVTIPNSVTSIGGGAFSGCTGLTAVHITDLSAWCKINFATYASDNPLFHAKNLYLNGEKVTNLVIPSDITEIKKYAFYKCSGLTSIEIPNSVTSIGDRAFENCTGLTNVTIGNSVTSIGNSAFYGCTGITEIYIEATIPPSVSSGAFYKVPVSIPVYVPAGSKTAYQAANTWKSFTNIVEISGGICGDDATWILRDSTLTISGSGAMYNYTDSVAPWSTYRLEIKEVVVNDSVTSIGDGAFFSCTGLASVTIGSCVTTIGESAFFRCTGLTSVTIGSGVASIGENAFERCTGLTSVTIPNSVTSIGDYAFNGCTGIKNVRIEDGDTRLNLGKNGFKGLFYYCPLESLYLGRNLNYNEYYGDGYSPFALITTLTSVTIGDNVNSLNTFLFKDCSNLNAITIPESVQIIEGYVFQYCDLREIHIPAGVTAIGDYAFSHNNNLEKITAAKENTRYSTPEGYNVLIDNNTIPGLATGIDGSTLVLGGKGAIIPDGIVSIGDGAFNGIHGITSITIPASVEAIGSYAFEACSDLKEIHCLATDRYISVSNFAFDGLYETTTLYIPAAGKKYYTGSWADFANIVVVGEIVVDGLSYAVISEEEKTVQVIDYSGSNEVVNIPSSITYNGEIYKVTAICYQAFKDYTNISGITIPASVSSIGYDAFYGCTNLASIKVESGNPVFDSRENCNAIITTAINELIQGCKNTIIPNSVTSIGDCAFCNCDGLTSVTIPNSVTSIGYSAFFGCSGLTNITIPNSVTSIGYSAFSYCSGLTSITIPNSVTWIGYHAFEGCTGLTSIEIPNSVTSIGDLAFNGCTGLTSVTIPSSVTSIGYGAFGCCSGLTSITIPNSVTWIGAEAFYRCTSLTSVTIPNSVTSIGDWAFNGCTNLATVVNNSSLDIIAGSEDHGRVAYYADEVINNRGGSVIGDFVFNDSGNLIKYIGNESEITLPEKSPAGIKYGIVEAFQNNTKITSVIIPDSVSFIYNTFSGCTSLTSVTIGNGVHQIGEAAFQDCTSLTEITIGDNVMWIDDMAFQGCTSLTSVTIGNGVHRIGEAAFQGCSALKDLYVNGIVPALLYSESFAEHYASATLHVPAGTKAAYQSSTSQREEMEIKILPVYNNDLLASMSGCDKDAIYETVKVEAQNPDVAGTLNGNDYLLAYQPLKTKMTDLPKATFETNIVHGGRYKIALVTVPWFIESYKDTLISSSFDPLYADSYLRVRVNQNNEQLAMFPCDSFNIGTSKTNFGVWEKHAIVPDRSRIDTIFLKDANNEDYIFDFVNGHSVGVNIELLRPLQYNERNGRYTAKNANAFAFRFLLDQIMLIPVDESTIVSTIYWKNFNNIVEEANDLTGDVDGDGTVDVADATTLVSMILDNSLASDAADVDGDGTVDVADVTSLVSIILGKDTASAAPAKAAATRAGEESTVSADGDGETLLINITNPGYEFSAIQFDLDLPEGIEVAMDEEYYEVYLGSRAHRKHSDPECAVQADGSLRVVIMSLSNALFSGTEGDVATVLLKANGIADGEYPFTIKNVVISSTGKEILAPYTGWITVSGGVTGIDEIKEERAESNAIYDLQGRKVTEPVKGGIYIVNGKKVIW